MRRLSGLLASLPRLLYALRPHNAAMLVALAGVGAAFAYAFSEETPVGNIRGQVYIVGPNRPLSDVEITLYPTGLKGRDRRFHIRYADSGADGRFTFTNVPAGTYQIAASAKSHRTGNFSVYVDEGRTTEQVLPLDRSEPDLQVKQHQRAFGTAETPTLPVSGYTESVKPGERDRMRVRVFKTRLSTVLTNEKSANALESVGRSYDAAPGLPKDLLHPKEGRAPQLVSERDVPITEDDREGFFYQKLEFGRLAAGLYLIDVRHAARTVSAWLLVTDTALVTKRTGSQLLAYAVDMQQGTPVAGSLIRAYRRGRVVAQGQTDGRGLSELTLPTKRHPRQMSGDEGNDEGGSGGDWTRTLTVATRGEDEAIVAGNSYENEAEGEFVLQAYTDRPIYRPGQRIYFKGIARRFLADTGSRQQATGNRQQEKPNPRNPNPEPRYPDGIGNRDGERRYSVPTGEPISVEIRDPSGERILQQRMTANQFGSFFGSVDLMNEAPTGVYNLIMHVRGETHTHDIVVAAYQKPEFAVTVTPDKRRYTRGEQITMRISAQYYFGAPVGGAKVKYTVYSAPDWSAEYPDDYEYEPGDEQSLAQGDGESYYGEAVTEGETTLDENGKAVLSFRAAPPKEKEDDASGWEGPQEQTYTASVTISRDAEREVMADGMAKVTAGDFRLTVSPDGYMGAPGQPANVTLAAKDYDGSPVPNVPVTLETGYQEWKRDEYQYQKVGVQQAVTGADGKVSLVITPPRDGELLLKARASDSQKRRIQGRAWLWVAGDEGGDLQTQYADLSLLTDRRRYSPGDTARVLINAARAGESVLLTVEGEKVYRTRLITMKQRSTVVRVPILSWYGPNIFLAACYVRDKKFAQSETPLRVSTPQREIKVTVRADREPEVRGQRMGDGKRQPPTPDSQPLPKYQPGDSITYTVLTTDTQGRPTPCEFSFGVVDESIYALREDDPAALRDAFYPRRVNTVETAYSFAVEYLGDADKAEPQIATRKKFPDTAYWDPALRTDAQGRATVRFNLPDSLTTWRATAVAQTLDTRIGRAVDKIYTTKDFFVRVEAPRFLTQRDRSRIVALVHNETGTAQTALVRLRVEGLSVSGDLTQTLTLEPGTIGQATWPVTAEGIGRAKVTVTAWTPKTAGAMQVTDGVETGFPIRAHGRETVTAFAGEVTAAHPETEVLRLDPQAIPGASRLTIRISPSIASSLLGAVDYLVGYPYGCTEQTMSRFLPDLLVQRALRLNGLHDVQQAAELPRMVREGLQRLYRFQHKETGGWGWWEHDEDDPWMTAYVLYGLATAQAEGYPVSKNALASGREAATKMLPKVRAADKPFLLYGLAVAGGEDAARKTRRNIRPSGLDAEGLAWLVLLDRKIGKPSGPVLATGRDAREPASPLEPLNAKAVSEDAMTHWKTDRDYFEDAPTATAMALRALLAVNPQDPRIHSILRWLMTQRTGDYWRSTRDTSWVLTAFCDYLATRPVTSSGGEVRVRLNGKVIRNYALTGDLLREQELVTRVPTTALQPDKNDVTLERAGGTSPIFYAVELRQTVAMEDIPPLAPPQLSVQREYLRVLPMKAGQDAWTLQTEPTHNQLNKDDRIRVRLTVNVPRDMAYVLIEDPFPAGCEVTERGEAEEVVEWNYWWSSVDVRDDRVAFFARTLTKGQHVIEYNLRAQTPGVYHTLPTLLQAMYAPQTRAESAEARIEIK
jgi:uncharacterized protein YfaS (alpha-2-macroglobulin family)